MDMSSLTLLWLWFIFVGRKNGDVSMTMLRTLEKLETGDKGLDKKWVPYQASPVWLPTSLAPAPVDAPKSQPPSDPFGLWAHWKALAKRSTTGPFMSETDVFLLCISEPHRMVLDGLESHLRGDSNESKSMGIR
ncbi:hypothetical protein P691DRAFT_595099 [Macrolepiota fuliginosa MF-IS2]|uniref:Uncharacterized protein n=1 Tax=Macrolepiota fuliginosa MF-IS2 TaxID=1400762 RepID=A0A9P5XDU4_9AGAR|nr:hypothetical protein P691DRAFT_595099 [Macrolepiota fuliginosa MF-IS2]